MEDLITVPFFNQSPSWEGRLIVCLFTDTRFLERYVFSENPEVLCFRDRSPFP